MVTRLIAMATNVNHAPAQSSYMNLNRELMDGDTPVVMIRCLCGRLKRHQEWVRPSGKDHRDIENNIHRIRFIPETCDLCKEGRK
jgi:hypothetical protein